MRLKFKIPTFIFVVIFIILSVCSSVAAVPYDSYIYESETDRVLPSPAAVVPSEVVDLNSLGIGLLSDPADLFHDSKGNNYILDSGNSRIICTDETFKTLFYILTTTGEYDFKNAKGIFVNEEHIFVADTENGRILKFTLPTNQETANTAAVKPQVITPKNMLSNQKVFRPLKLVVDNMQRFFIVCEGVYDGLVELAADGEFLAYVGSNRISLSIGEQIWKAIATREQWDASEKTVPVEFSNIALDSEGFMFTTSRGTSDDSLMIRRLNLNGTDVLNTDVDSKIGDIDLDVKEEKTYFVDVAVGENGMFAGLDATRGRIFVYDDECSLLFEFGGIGSQVGQFQSPASVLWLTDANFCVLDSISGNVVIFRMTDYGELLTQSVAYEKSGNYDKAKEAYRSILKLNSNNEYAYRGIGRQFYREGNYEEALKYLKLGNDKEYYSKAFIKSRKDVLEVIIPIVIIAILVIATIAFVLFVKNVVKSAKKRIDEIKLLGEKISEREERRA